MLDQNLHKNHSYSTFVLLLTIEQNTMKIGIKVEVLHVTTLTTRPFHQIDTVLHPEIDLVMTKVLLLQNTLDHDMILTNAIHALTVHHTDLLIDRLIDTILALDTDHAPIQETTILQDIQIHTDHLPDQEILDSRFSRSRSHSNSKNKINMIQPQDQSDSKKFEVHMYHPTEMANAVTPTSWFYTLYVHTPSSIIHKR